MAPSGTVVVICVFDTEQLWQSVVLNITPMIAYLPVLSRRPVPLILTSCPHFPLVGVTESKDGLYAYTGVSTDNWIRNHTTDDVKVYNRFIDLAPLLDANVTIMRKYQHSLHVFSIRRPFSDILHSENNLV